MSILKNYLTIVYSLIRYNLKIIFGGKFTYFLFAALVVYVSILVMNLFDPNVIHGDVSGFWSVLVPGLLLVFYPSTFGIQNDIDTRMIEILFGIPDYRYKVWLIRLLLIYIVTFISIAVLTFIYSITLARIPVWEMSLQLMAPVLFMGGLGFMLSTLIRNGNGTAVVLILIGLGFWLSQGQIGNTEWNLFLNPYNVPSDVNQTVWAETTLHNRIYLVAGTIIVILWGLLNLQKRERFV